MECYYCKVNLFKKNHENGMLVSIIIKIIPRHTGQTQFYEVYCCFFLDHSRYDYICLYGESNSSTLCKEGLSSVLHNPRASRSSNIRTTATS